jgi:hypothetical protein
MRSILISQVFRPSAETKQVNVPEVKQIENTTQKISTINTGGIILV